MDYVDYFASAALGVIGYVGVQFAVKPISELRTTREAIAKSLVLFAKADTVVNVTGSDDARALEARAKYRELASTLIAQANSIPFYGVWSCLRITPTFKDIEKARANLIGLSNAVGVQGQSLENSRRQQNIEQALRLRT